MAEDNFLQKAYRIWNGNLESWHIHAFHVEIQY